jgi:hypothetical protein
MTARVQWFAAVLQAGLETRILVEKDVLVHATPAVLIKALPRDVLVTMFETALTAGAISAESVVQTATPELLAEHAPGNVIWGCIVAAAEHANITGTGDKSRIDTNAREFVRRALAAALGVGVVAPADVVRHVDPRVLVHEFPAELTTKLLEASLADGKMTPQLIIDTLGGELALHAPRETWQSLAKAGEALATATPTATPRTTPPAPPRPSLEVIDEEIATVLVELEDSAVMKPMRIDPPPPAETKPAAKGTRDRPKA